MDTKIFTWSELVKYLLGFVPISNRDWGLVVTYSRLAGIGKAISFQKTEYSSAELEIMCRLLKWWSYLGEFSNIDFRDREATKELIKNIVYNQKNKKPQILYAIYCPSYKKGRGMIGYRGHLGKRSKSVIKLMASFVKTTNDYGIPMKGLAYFSDLLLENYHLIVGTNYKRDLANNFFEFANEFKKYLVPIETKKLSDFEYLRINIGEQGRFRKQEDVNDGLYKMIYKRNFIFYEKKLGWTKEMIKDRTLTLIASYEVLGKFFLKKFNHGIMFWTESAYERGVMYNAGIQDDKIPIIYLKK